MQGKKQRQILFLNNESLAFLALDAFFLLYLLSGELVLRMANALGFAWWAKVETKGPDMVYWFGPFVTKKSLEDNLSRFLIDLKEETPSNISSNLIRCFRGSSFTIDNK